MELIEVTPEEYTKIIPIPYHVFNCVGFCELNKNKVDKVVYLLFKDSKYRLGIVGGIKDGVFLSPFSAPFGGFSFIDEDTGVFSINQSIEDLLKWSLLNNIKEIKITLPPDIYSRSFIAKEVNSLYRSGFSVSRIDINHSICLAIVDDNYNSVLWRNARKNLAIAQKANLKLVRCDSLAEKECAYNVIKKNREERGFPLRMTWEQIKETVELISSDFFVVSSNDGILIASAIVFHVTNSISQVIYWGDLPEYSNLRTMNFLSFEIFSYYSKMGKKHIDIGPSSEDSVPNYGLCEFKESIGCDVTPKFSFHKLL